MISQVTNKYGGEIAQYRKVVQDYPSTYDQIKSSATGEAAKMADLPLEQMQGNEALQPVVLALVRVQQMPQQLQEVKDAVERITKQKLPDWKGATDAIDSGMTTMSSFTAQIIENFQKSKDDPKAAGLGSQYMADSVPKYQQIKKIADAMHAQIAKLGELKLDDLRPQLRQRDSILVMGDTDMRTIPEDKVWQDQKDFRQLALSGQQIKPSFAGEQQISTAILALTRPSKPLIAFVRAGGPPLARAPPTPWVEKRAPGQHGRSSPRLWLRCRGKRFVRPIRHAGANAGRTPARRSDR